MTWRLEPYDLLSVRTAGRRSGRAVGRCALPAGEVSGPRALKGTWTGVLPLAPRPLTARAGVAIVARGYVFIM